MKGITFEPLGSVNANRAQHEAAARMITRCLPLSRWQEAFERQRGNIVVEFTGERP